MISASLFDRKKMLCLTDRGVALPDWKGGVSSFHLERKVSLPDWKRKVSLSHSEMGGLASCLKLKGDLCLIQREGSLYLTESV